MHYVIIYMPKKTWINTCFLFYQTSLFKAKHLDRIKPSLQCLLLKSTKLRFTKSFLYVIL